MRENHTATAHILAIMTVIIWGTTFVSTKVLLNHFTPIEILFIRFSLGLVALFLISPTRMKVVDRKHELYFIGTGLSGVTLYFLFENIALTHSPASNIGIIVSIAPFFTAILSHFFIKGTKLTKNFFIGFAFAIIGITFISLNGETNLEVNPIGDILAVLAAVVWAFYSVIIKKISDMPYTNIQATRRTFMYGLLFMIPLLFLMDFNLTAEKFQNVSSILNLIYLGVGASAICFLSWNYAIKVLGTLRSSVYIYMVPVTTVLASSFILGEKITLSIILGTTLTLFGLYLSERKPKNNSQ